MATLQHVDDEDLEALANIGVWGQRDQGISVDTINRPISPSDMEYLRSRCPYIQILNIDATFEHYTSVHFIKAKSGWTIQDLDDGLCTSVGPYMFGGSDSPAIEDAESKDPDSFKKYINMGNGTVVKQAFDTAYEMVELIKSRWKGGIEIIAGSDLMKWALWVAAEEYKLKLIGYEASEKDKEKRARLTRLEREKALAPRPKNQQR